MKIHPLVSDLFFNHEHPTYTSLFDPNSQGPTRAQMRAALIEDARDFAVCVTGLTNEEITPEDCADDFLARV